MTDTDVTDVPPNAGPLGRLVEHDPLSRQYPARTAGPRGPLVSIRHVSHVDPFDQSRYFPSVAYQPNLGPGPLSLGSCVGNTIIGILTYDPFWATIQTHPLIVDGVGQADAVEVIYMPATRNDPWPGSYPPDDTGTSGLAGAKAAKDAGLISGYRHGFSTDDDLAALTGQAEGPAVPVATGLNWPSSFDRPDAEGIVRLPANPTFRGGHEFVVDEYDDARGLVGCRNSWGLRFGIRGRFYMEVEAWSRLRAMQGDTTMLVPLSLPAPTPVPVVTPGAAPFPGASDAVSQRIVRAAERSGLTVAEYQNRRWRGYFGISG